MRGFLEGTKSGVDWWVEDNNERWMMCMRDTYTAIIEELYCPILQQSVSLGRMRDFELVADCMFESHSLKASSNSCSPSRFRVDPSKSIISSNYRVVTNESSKVT